MKLIVAFAVAYFFGSVSAASLSYGDDDDELILVHTLFRHGNRTIGDNIYTNNPYGNESFYAPYGYGQLTKIGKRTEYQIGLALRERYDSFIGPEYNIKLIDPRSTPVNRTKMSLLLVLAGLFPPTEDELWKNDLLWQPIPYNTYDNDKEIYGRKVCTNYKKAYKKLIKTDEILDKLAQYQEVFDYLTEKTGDKIQKPKEVSDLYIELLIQNAYGYPPEDWFYTYEEQMANLAAYNYRLLAYSTKLKRLCAGYLIKKIIADTEDRIANPDSPTKMFLYSAHETNIANLLVTLDVYDDQIPAFGSYVIVEARRVDDVYGFKFYYQNYQSVEPVLLTLPGCEEFCPLDTFQKLMDDFIPADDYCELGDDDDGDNEDAEVTEY